MKYITDENIRCLDYDIQNYYCYLFDPEDKVLNKQIDQEEKLIKQIWLYNSFKDSDIVWFHRILSKTVIVKGKHKITVTRFN